ncbi:hypothetical protein SBF1_7770005 [Candidatus Desulfosporosinus infrequens]|uniref:Uncharacterized protein n=1 Tax=Candidatus Desulfosporosinus infrequens TaxID=2043169 RepID=A0A2U3LRZ5_9FIRM|nr:hypothetical protein SBF1_7770005 [Candidatus Desulfosporosinus infrequens]
MCLTLVIYIKVYSDGSNYCEPGAPIDGSTSMQCDIVHSQFSEKNSNKIMEVF